MLFGPFLFIYGLLFFLLLAFLFALIEVHIIHYAFTLAGLPPELAMLALLVALIGSWINVPIARLRSNRLHQGEVIIYHGMRYRPPIKYGGGQTVLAVNVGGAVVPVAIVAYLLFKQPAVLWPAAAATLIVGLVVNYFARPVPGLGIATPIFIPPILAALAAYVLAGPAHVSAVAFISGVLGTLLGADIANLGKLGDLGAPVASIGGAGTFDGIFLTGIVAVLLA